MTYQAYIRRLVNKSWRGLPGTLNEPPYQAATAPVRPPVPRESEPTLCTGPWSSDVLVALGGSNADLERFVSKVCLGDPLHYWLWVGCTQTCGYGRMRVGGRSRLAHRLSYHMATRQDPGKLCVCHACDVPGCVNPAHLWLGTHADNMRDIAVKGRHYTRTRAR